MCKVKGQSDVCKKKFVPSHQNVLHDLERVSANQRSSRVGAVSSLCLPTGVECEFVQIIH